MNFAKMKVPIFTPTPRRPKRNKPPIKRRIDDGILQDNSGTTFHFGPESIKQRSFDYATEPLETSGQVSSSLDEIADLPQEVSDHGPIGTQPSDHSQGQTSSAVKTDANLHHLERLRAALEHSERIREEERKRHEYREKELMETVQIMSDLVDG